MIISSNNNKILHKYCLAIHKVDGKLSNMAKKHVLCLIREQCDLGYRNIWPMRTDDHIAATCTYWYPWFATSGRWMRLRVINVPKKSKCTVQNIIDFLILANTEFIFFIFRLEKYANNLHVYADLKSHFWRCGPSYGIYCHHNDMHFIFSSNVLFWHRNTTLESMNNWQPDVPEYTYIQVFVFSESPLYVHLWNYSYLI